MCDQQSRRSGVSPVRLRVIGRRFDRAANAADLFARLTENGTEPGSVLLESGDLAPTYAERSIGVVRPSLSVSGREQRVVITALDRLGRHLLPRVRDHLPAAAEVVVDQPGRVEAVFPIRPIPASFEERLRCCPHIDVLRALQPAVVNEAETDRTDEALPIGLFGCFAYDLICHFEDIPRVACDPLGEPDYLFFLATRVFLINHVRGDTTLYSAVPDDTTEHDADAACELDRMESALNVADSPTPVSATAAKPVSDTTRDEYTRGVTRIKRAVEDGRVFQAVYGRMMSGDFSGDPFAVYRALKRCNPSPFLFYIRDERGVLMGASPELAVRVSHQDGRRTVEIKPIAGTKPRGLLNGRIDADLDARFEVALKVDPKELAEHTMLIDLARNDVCSVSKPGTTQLLASFAVEKYSHVQHLVSHIRGELRDDLDAFDAYVATMNMGTLTGAPKPEAMRIIAELERSARGFFGGAVGFVNAAGEMETTIVIRAMRVTDGHVHIRAGAGIVADSVPENEWDETERKAAACIQALKEAGHER